MSKVFTVIRRSMKQYTMMLALLVIVLMFQGLTGGKLLLPMNVYNVLNQNAYIVILAIGMLLCIIGSGSIDLSVGSVVGLVGACAGTFIMKWKWDPYLVIFLCMGIGILVGVWQGFWIAYVKIPAFIVTLSGMLVFRGTTLVILYAIDFIGGVLLSVGLVMNSTSPVVEVQRMMAVPYRPSRLR